MEAAAWLHDRGVCKLGYTHATHKHTHAPKHVCAPACESACEQLLPAPACLPFPCPTPTTIQTGVRCQHTVEWHHQQCRSYKSVQLSVIILCDNPVTLCTQVRCARADRIGCTRRLQKAATCPCQQPCCCVSLHLCEQDDCLPLCRCMVRHHATTTSITTYLARPKDAGRW